jgi:hypothetical protein
VKQLFVAMLVVPLLAAPAFADAKADARTNCTREIVASSDVTRNEIKAFVVTKTGDGYEMSGHTDTHQSVSCKAAEDGRATWVSVH